MASRCSRGFPDSGLEETERLRAEMLNSVICHGPAWLAVDSPEAAFKEVLLSLSTLEEQQKQIRRGIYDGVLDAEVVGAVRTPGVKKKWQGRQGAKQVNRIEQEVDAQDKLTPAGATSYRALAARLNYLAQDRPDIAFAAKELCRDFAVPSISSLKKLKRVARYLLLVPRLGFKYP